MPTDMLQTVSWATDVLSRDPRQLFQVVRVLLSDLRRVTGMDAAELYLADPQQTYLMLSGQAGQDSEAFLERRVFAFGEGFPGLAAQRREVLATTHLQTDAHYLRAEVKALGYRGFVTHPLLLPHAVVGVLGLATRDPARLETARASLAFCAPLLATSLYAVMTSLGERTLARMRQAPTARERALALLEDALETHPEQMSACRVSGCPAERGQVCAPGMPERRCVTLADAPPTVCLPLHDGGEVRAVASLQFAAGSPGPGPLAAPLLWLSRFAVGALALADTPGEQSEHPWLEIETFGAFRVRRGGEWLAPKDFKRRQAYQLFKLLVTRWGRPLHASELCEALWPSEGEDDRAMARLHVTLNALRQVVEPDGETGRVILRDGPTYRFAPTLPYRLDAQEFEALVREADGQGGQAALDTYGRALRLYRGSYMEDDPYADHFALERDYLRELAVRALLRCAELQEAAGQMQDALTSYSHILTIDSLRFEAHEALIGFLVGQGRLEDARSRWERYAQAYGGRPPLTAP